jgi:Tol biopolymer transport system component
VVATPTDTGPAPNVAAATAGIAKAPKVAQSSTVAYRSGGSFWVATEKGTSAKKLIPAPSSASFAISPDGKWLAVADGDNGVLHIVNTSTGANMKVAGAADTVKPSWAPDSSFVVYCGTDTDKRSVKQVKTDGSKPIVLAAGTAPRVAPDGKTVYYVQMPGADEFGPVALVNAGQANGKTTVVVKSNAQEVAVVQDGIVYAAADGSKALYRAKLDGSSPSVLVAVPKKDGADSFSNIFVTRDGKRVAYDVSGAQGFARLGVVAFAGGSAKDLSNGKDSYTLGWLADGSAVTYTTGNISADPNAKSDLRVVSADGSNDRVLVAGGGQ